MKGFIKRSKQFFQLEDSSVFNSGELERSMINIADEETGDITQEKYSSLSQEEKGHAKSGLALEANSILRALNGEVKSGMGVGKFVRNSINAGTFGNVFGTAVEVFILDYLRPQLIVSNMLANTIPVGPSLNRSIIALVRSFGMIKVKEVPKTGTLPIVNPDLAEYAEQIAYDIKKYGVKLEIDKDLSASDEWGVLGYILTQIADAFRYRKEEEVLKVINQTGEVLIDNKTTAAGSLKTTTTGRDIRGGLNGTVALEDFQRSFAYMQMRGQDPAIILVHPFVLFNMYGDSELRSVLGLSEVVGDFPGNAMDPGWDHPFGEDFGYKLRGIGGNDTVGADVTGFGPAGGLGPLGTLGVDPHGNNLASLNMHSTFKANIPGLNLTVISSPLVPIKTVNVGLVGGGTADRFLTNIYVVGSKKPVAILQEHGPAPMEWEDVEKEVMFLGFREKYAVLPMYQGRGMYTLKNVVIDKNYPRPTVVDQNGSVTEPSTSPIAGL